MIQSSFAVPLCTPYVSQKFLKCRIWNVFWLTMAFSHPFKEDRLVLPLSIPLFQAIDDVMSLGLCMQAPSSTTLKIFQEANHLWGLLCPPVSICSVISLHSGMSRAVHQSGFGRWMSTTDAFQSGLPIPPFSFCSKLTESVRMMACVVWLSPLEAIQHGWLLPPPLWSAGDVLGLKRTLLRRLNFSVLEQTPIARMKATKRIKHLCFSVFSRLCNQSRDIWSYHHLSSEDQNKKNT